MGGAFVLGADLLAQRLMYPVTIPIGIVSAFCGVPMFLMLLVKGSSDNAARLVN
jgi:iron complex transport system permease protein